MDKSALLQRLIDKEYGGDPLMLLGELQVAAFCILFYVLSTRGVIHLLVPKLNNTYKMLL